MYETRESLYNQIDETQERLDSVIEYINSNPDSDPNAYEMNDLMFKVAEIGCKGRNFESEPYAFLKDEKYSKLRDDFYAMIDYRMEQLNSKENGLKIPNSNTLYDYFKKGTMSMATLNTLGDKEVSDAYSKACGINLYIRQRYRDLSKDESDEIIYDNFKEVEDLKESIKNIDSHLDNIKSLAPLMEEIEIALNRTPKEFIQAIKSKEQEEMSI